MKQHKEKEETHKKNICIICGSDLPKTSLENAKKINENDFILVTLRNIKAKIFQRKTGLNNLYVCNNCLDNYNEKRKRFESTMNTIIIIGLLLGIVVIGLPLIYLRLPDLVSIVFSLIFILMFVVLAILSYVPPLVKEINEQKNEKKS